MIGTNNHYPLYKKNNILLFIPPLVHLYFLFLIIHTHTFYVHNILLKITTFSFLENYTIKQTIVVIHFIYIKKKKSGIMGGYK